MKRILLIEDDPDMLALLEKKISDQNEQVRIVRATTVKRARELYQKYEIDIVSIDITLENETAGGFVHDLLEESKQQKLSISILLYSQHINEEFKARMLEREIFAFKKGPELGDYLDQMKKLSDIDDNKETTTEELEGLSELMDEIGL